MAVLPYTLQSKDGRAFRANGERAHLLAWLRRTCPNLTQSVRVGIARMIERGLHTLGRTAMNLAITNLHTFEQRLAVTPLQDHGYPAYFERRLRWAARFLHAAAHEADDAYLQQLLHRRRPSPTHARQAGATPFALAPRGGHRPRAARGSANDNGGAHTATGGGQQPAGTRSRAAGGPDSAHPGPIEVLERAIVRNIERLDTIPVDQSLVQHMVPVCMRLVSTEHKVELMRLIADDLARQLHDGGGADRRASVDAVAEQLIAQVLYPRVAARVCTTAGNRDRGDRR